MNGYGKRLSLDSGATLLCRHSPLGLRPDGGEPCINDERRSWLQEVIVTARMSVKTSGVPITITAISGEDIRRTEHLRRRISIRRSRIDVALTSLDRASSPIPSADKGRYWRSRCVRATYFNDVPTVRDELGLPFRPSRILSPQRTQGNAVRYQLHSGAILFVHGVRPTGLKAT